MNTVMKLALATAMMIGAAQTASAAVITRTYTISSVFNSSDPIKAVTNTFTVTFDPTISASNIAVDAYTSNSISPAFAGPIGYSTRLESSGIFDLYLGRLPSVTGITAGIDDFRSIIQINAAGEVLGSFTTLYTVAATNPVFYRNVSQVVTSTPSVSAVPEPKTWAMLLVGFGMIGATARYRRRHSSVRYA